MAYLYVYHWRHEYAFPSLIDSGCTLQEGQYTQRWLSYIYGRHYNRSFRSTVLGTIQGRIQCNVMSSILRQLVHVGVTNTISANGCARSACMSDAISSYSVKSSNFRTVTCARHPGHSGDAWKLYVISSVPFCAGFCRVGLRVMSMLFVVPVPCTSTNCRVCSESTSPEHGGFLA